ncbi:MAG TPA: copper chaperone PCu(A)C [Burkholderiaceae bacterium]|jgi:copper(I)-binding protein|nr:copper chaperone PCu(A)C [Burkholderiaceae bacterium]
MMKQCLAVLGAALMMNIAMADDYHANNVHVDHVVARATVPGQTSGVAYLTIENKGNAADKLVGVSSPIATSTEIHSMAMDGTIMRMREVSDLALPPAAKIVMAPGGGYHIMLMGLKKPLAMGDKIPLSLRFEKAGKLDVTVVVESK